MNLEISHASVDLILFNKVFSVTLSPNLATDLSAKELG